MEASNSSMSRNDEEQLALKCLFDAFGSTFSLREIASAYHQAGNNSDVAGEVLFTMHESSSSCITEEEMARNSSESSNGNISEKSSQVDGNSKATKQKRCSSTMGSVSSVIGKDYTRSTPLAYGPCITTKPLKLDSKNFPEVDIWEDESSANPLSCAGENKDMEEFLFKVLGEGFNLDMPAIREVLARCGCDMQKSMDKLLYLSEGTSTESNSYCSRPPKKLTDACPKAELSSYQNKLLHMNSSGSNGNRGSVENGIENSREEKKKIELQKEVLTALFDFDSHARLQEPPHKASLKRAVVKKSRPFIKVVSEPYIESTSEFVGDIVYTKKDYVEDEDSDYQVLRKAAKEYREAKQQYYKATADAFKEGKCVLAGNLLDKGMFFHQKACEAEEESSQLTFETRDVDEENVYTLDLQYEDAKEAMRLLKCYLSSFSAFKYLKVIMETNEADSKKGARRKYIMKLLEKESIEWKEGTPDMLVIALRMLPVKGVISKLVPRGADPLGLFRGKGSF